MARKLSQQPTKSLRPVVNHAAKDAPRQEAVHCSPRPKTAGLVAVIRKASAFLPRRAD
jgi:hypothetical protein